ncbi:hypothetical protein VTK26DRAFT_3785 [Humicola hyalothermophila]
MNSDEIMPDAPATSFEDGTKAGAAARNTKKFRDEYEAYKNRLQDQKFSIADYPDPLAPRTPHPKQYPKGAGREVEAKLKELIAEIRAGGGAGSAA